MSVAHACASALARIALFSSVMVVLSNHSVIQGFSGLLTAMASANLIDTCFHLPYNPQLVERAKELGKKALPSVLC